MTMCVSCPRQGRRPRTTIARPRADALEAEHPDRIRANRGLFGEQYSSDHACVTPQVRGAAAANNRAAEERKARD